MVGFCSSIAIGTEWSLSCTNHRIAGFLREEECLEALDALRRQWTWPSIGFSEQETRYYDLLCCQRFFIYARQGFSERLIELRPDFTIGDGATPVENRWMIEDDKDGSPLLSLRNENGAACFLRFSNDGRWRGTDFLSV